jgi:hypothetical protein
MRARYDRVTYDIFDDQWLCLFDPQPLPEEIPPWTDEEILYLCDRLLENSLRSLFDGRCSIDTAVEIHKWMTEPKDMNPFSFNRCCEVSGLDPETIREEVLNRYKRTHRQLH